PFRANFRKMCPFFKSRFEITVSLIHWTRSEFAAGIRFQRGRQEISYREMSIRSMDACPMNPASLEMFRTMKRPAS
ncbi:MAG: hypothetical protein ACKVT0_19170, partial [Planctomycetaceae bacterium]